MKYNNFYIEKNQYIDAKDLENIRILYTPIIGLEAVSFYHFLIDESNLADNPRYLFNFNDITKLLNCDYEVIKEAKEKLEAVGLIRTFESNLFKNYIISINKPLNIEQYKKSVLAKQLIKIIGYEKYQKVLFSQKLFLIDKDEYFNVSKKYTELFELKDNSNINIEKLHEEFEQTKTIKTNSDLTKSLTPEQFIKQKTLNDPTVFQKKMIFNLVDLGFLYEQINLFIDFSLKVNGQIVCNYIEKIAKDYHDRKIILTTDIKNELQNALQVKDYSKTKETSNYFVNYGMEELND